VLATFELAVAVGAASPFAAQRLALVVQAVLLTAFVGLIVVARRADVPCGCHGAGDAKPRASRLVVGGAASGAAWLVAAGPLPGITAMSGVVLGCLVAVALVRAVPTAPDPVAHPEARRAGEQMTRRSAMAHGATAIAAMAAGILFGWKGAPVAGALESGRRITPRLAHDEERRAAAASARVAELLAQYRVDARQVAWDRALSYEDGSGDRTIVTLVAPIVGSDLTVGHVGAGAGLPAEVVTLLDSGLTGSVAADDRTYELEKGRIVGGRYINTTSSFAGDFNECLSSTGAGVIALCCGLCGFTGPAVMGPCCGGCAIGTLIGCLYVAWQ
jgi:hypothetical protein